MALDPSPIVVFQSYRVSVKRVWRAITQVDEMRRWFFNNIPDFQAKVGFETRFDVESSGRVFPHFWRVTDVDPNKRIAYEWLYEGYVGRGHVSFHLYGYDDQTILVLTCHGAHTFDQHIPEFKRSSGVAGWKYFIQDSLKSYLERPE